LNIIHVVHQAPKLEGISSFSQSSLLKDALYISFNAWYGLNRFANGMKYQPTDHAGVYLRPFISNNLFIFADKYIHLPIIKIEEII